jgi:hypothetical protein
MAVPSVRSERQHRSAAPKQRRMRRQGRPPASREDVGADRAAAREFHRFMDSPRRKRPAIPSPRSRSRPRRSWRRARSARRPLHTRNPQRIHRRAPVNHRREAPATQMAAADSPGGPGGAVDEVVVSIVELPWDVSPDAIGQRAPVSRLMSGAHFGRPKRRWLSDVAVPNVPPLVIHRRSRGVMLVLMAPNKTRIPATFRVSADVGMMRGGGQLTVAPGHLGFLPNVLTRRLGSASPVEHASRNVRLVRARWIPPWFNVSIQLRGTQGSCLVMLPSWSRRPLARH